jgi:cysteine desulfurase
MNKPIYLDYNATTPMAAEVLDAMLPFFREQYGNAASRSHVYGWQANAAVENASKTIAEALGCQPNEIVYTSGATESINLAIKGLVNILQAGNVQVLSAKTEHNATLEVLNCYPAASVKLLEVNRTGCFSEQTYQQSIHQNTKLISLTWANNETGIVWDIPHWIQIAKSINQSAYFHTDATQAVGKIPLNFAQSGADLLSMSGHKIYGPKGIGLLLVKNGTKLTEQIHGGRQQSGRRSGTLNVPLIVGLAKACQLACQNLETYQQYTLKLRTQLEHGLLQIPDSQLNSTGNRLPNTSNISFGGIDGETLLDSLSQIAVASGSACTSATVEPSHVLMSMGLSPEQAFASIRFSLGLHTTPADIDTAIKHVKQVIQKLRN